MKKIIPYSKLKNDEGMIGHVILYRTDSRWGLRDEIKKLRVMYLKDDMFAIMPGQKVPDALRGTMNGDKFLCYRPKLEVEIREPGWMLIGGSGGEVKFGEKIESAGGRVCILDHGSPPADGGGGTIHVTECASFSGCYYSPIVFGLKWVYR